MLSTREGIQAKESVQTRPKCQIAVLWIGWYSHHLSRFRALLDNPELGEKVVGIEMAGGVDVHAGLKFREPIPDSFPVETLLPGGGWHDVKASWHDVRVWKSASAVWKRLNRLDPNLVLVPGYHTPAGLAAAVWGKVHRRRTVLMTERAEQGHKRERLKESFKGLLVGSLFDWAISGGAAHRRYLERLGFPSDRIGRFYDVVDNEFFGERADALRKAFRASDFGLPAKYFLYVGRLAEEKNLETLLSAYVHYRRSGGTWSLIVVGDGPLRGRLEQEAASSPFGAQIRFEGLRGTPELPQYYAYASCFVLPSLREPWGLVANEAMASGLPVIISQTCGCADDLVVEGENGLLFDPANTSDLTASLIAMGGLSSGLLYEMGQRSRSVIARFSPRNWAAEVARIARAEQI